jgi:6-phosphofructokinase 2
MSTIITITFSPCIDKSTSVPALIPEKKLKCTAPRLEPGGGGINVARAIRKLGGEAVAIYPAGGYTGKYFNKLLADEDIQAIIIESKNETRENIIVLEESSNQQFRFGMPGTELSENEWQAMLDTVQNLPKPSFIVASGSLPPGVPLDIYARLARIAKAKSARLIVDTSGEALRHAAEEGVYLLKPNLAELASLAGIAHLEAGEVALAAREVINKGDCEVMVVSMGAEGAMLVSKTLVLTFRPPRVERKSTVGAGDSMVAGIVMSLSAGRSLADAVRYGVACGTAATMNPGTELCHKADVEKIYSRVLSTEPVM